MHRVISPLFPNQSQGLRGGVTGTRASKGAPSDNAWLPPSLQGNWLEGGILQDRRVRSFRE